MKTKKNVSQKEEKVEVPNNYEPPSVKTYTEGEIMEELGPARTSASNNTIPAFLPPTS